jgi:uncharacterized LabA/DUF88 family protein
LSSSSGLVDLPPLRAHVFIDGTWLYYSLVVGRGENSGRGDPMVSAYGKNWQSTNKISYTKFPQIIAKNLRDQLRTKFGQNREVEVTRTSAFTSMREDTPTNGLRMKMVKSFYDSNYDVHKLVTRNRQEKCVDIMLAVEMLSMATVPEAYDIAVIVTGDKDFIPAMKKTREKGKRVAIVSMRNSCNSDLTSPELMIRDFDNIWIEDDLAGLIEGKALQYDVSSDGGRDMNSQLVQLAVEMLQQQPGMTSGSRDIGRYFAARDVISTDKEGAQKAHRALGVVKELHVRMSRFFDMHTDTFLVEYGPSGSDAREFQVTLREDRAGAVGTGGGGEDDDYGTDTDCEEGADDTDVYGDVEEYLQSLDNAAHEIMTGGGADIVDYGSLKLADLKEECRGRGLPLSGTKAVLADRLLNDDL